MGLQILRGRQLARGKARWEESRDTGYVLIAQRKGPPKASIAGGVDLGPLEFYTKSIMDTFWRSRQLARSMTRNSQVSARDGKTMCPNCPRQRVAEGIDSRKRLSWAVRVLHEIHRGYVFARSTTSPLHHDRGFGSYDRNSAICPSCSRQRVAEGIDSRKRLSWAVRVLHEIHRGYVFARSTTSPLHHDRGFGSYDRNSAICPSCSRQRVAEGIDSRKRLSWAVRVLHEIHRGYVLARSTTSPLHHDRGFGSCDPNSAICPSCSRQRAAEALILGR